jgi:hypothetical protein
MAYHLWDGFDHYNAANELWTTSSGVVSYSSAFSRYPALPGMLSQGIKLQTSGAKRFNMTSNQPTMCFSLAALFNAPGNGTPAWMQFWDNATQQCTMGVTASGSLVLFAANGGTLATSAPGAVSFGVWHWLAFQVTINNATGSVVAYVDGVQVINASNLNTRNTANNYMNAFALSDVNGNMNAPQFDDFHAHDITGAAPNSLLLPDSRIYTKPDSGQGYSTLWTPTGAGTNWQCVDDAIPDGDATYVSSATPGQIDGYALPKVNFVVSPNGLVRRSLVRKDDAGAHTFQNGIRSGNSNALGVAFAVPSTYGWTDGGTCYVNDPATGLPFTAAAADAVQNIISMTS